MFYSANLQAKDTPQGRLWLAQFGKMSRADINSFSLARDCEGIIANIEPDSVQNAAALSLRVGSILLWSAVIILQRQVAYLKEECEGVLTNLKKASLPIDAAVNKKQSKSRRSKANAKKKEILQEPEENYDDLLGLPEEDAGWDLTDNTNSSSKKDEVLKGLDQYMQLDLNTMLNSQPNDGTQPGLGEFEMEDPEILRDASHDPTELDPEADAAFDLPRMTPVSGRSGSRRNSASRSLPSRNGSNPPPSPAVDRDGGGGDAAPVPLEDLAPPPDADAPMPDVDFEPPNFDAPMFDEDDQNVDNNVQTEVGEEARTPLKRGRDSVADADGTQGKRTPSRSPASAAQSPGTAPDSAGAVDGEIAQPADAGAASPAAASPKPVKRKQKRRGRALVKLYADPEREDGADPTRLPRSEVARYINDRSVFLEETAPLVQLEEMQQHVLDLSDDFDVLLRVRAPEPAGGVSTRVRRLYDAIAAAQPVPRAVWQNRGSADGSADGDAEEQIDEIEDVHNVPSPAAGAQQNGARTPSMEQLRDATPGASGAPPVLDFELRQSDGPDANGQLPDADAPPPDAFEQPDFDPPQPDFDMEPQPEVDLPALDGELNFDPPDGDQGGSVFEQLASQGRSSQGNEDSSLNEHTRATFARLEELAAAQQDSSGRKRSRGEDIWVPLTDLMLDDSRSEAAKTLYDALVLQGKQMVTIEQAEAFDDIQLCLVAAEF